MYLSAHILIKTHTYKHIHRYTQAHIQIHAQTYTNTRTHTHKLACINAIKCNQVSLYTGFTIYKLIFVSKPIYSIIDFFTSNFFLSNSSFSFYILFYTQNHLSLYISDSLFISVTLSPSISLYIYISLSLIQPFLSFNCRLFTFGNEIYVARLHVCIILLSRIKSQTFQKFFRIFCSVLGHMAIIMNITQSPFIEQNIAPRYFPFFYVIIPIFGIRLCNHSNIRHSFISLIFTFSLNMISFSSQITTAISLFLFLVSHTLLLGY